VTLEPTEPLPADDDEPTDETDQPAVAADDPSARVQRKSIGGSTNVLAAAMLAIGDILEPEKTTVEIVQTNDDPLDDLPPNINFGDLPPLD